MAVLKIVDYIDEKWDPRDTATARAARNRVGEHAGKYRAIVGVNSDHTGLRAYMLYSAEPFDTAEEAVAHGNNIINQLNEE